MPKYELMYIIGSETSDDQIPSVVEGVKKNIQADGGLIEKHEELGKKKLAYSINKTKIGYYAIDLFSAPSDRANAIEKKIRNNKTIIRHLMVNIEEDLVRAEKDKKAQAKMKSALQKQPPQAEKKTQMKPEEKTGKKIEIDLDAEIEKALESEDLK